MSRLDQWLVATPSWSQYSCYNPVMLPQLDLKGGRFTHFSCTFTDSFSNAPVKVPEYDYNNLVFRIDLDAVGHATILSLAGERIPHAGLDARLVHELGGAGDCVLEIASPLSSV